MGAVRRHLGWRLSLALQPKGVIDDFHRLYYNSGRQTWQNTYWMGVPLAKCPLDLWVYQELIHELRPDLIVETGTWRGGSALYLATLCDLVGAGDVISIDVRPEGPLPEHPRIRFLTGSSTDGAIYAEVSKASQGTPRVLVLLDSDHRCEHVLEELRLYSSIVPVGSYIVVEDTNVNGHPVDA